jgi:hypothetical protein
MLATRERGRSNMIRPAVKVVPLVLLALATSGWTGGQQARFDVTQIGGRAPDAAKVVPVMPAAGAELVAQAATPAAAAPPSAILKVLQLADWYRAALVDKTQIKDPHELEALVKPVCDGLKACAVGVWYDEASMPQKLPVRPEQLDEQQYRFGRTYDGTEESLWNCDKYPEFEAEKDCLPREMR